MDFEAYLRGGLEGYLGSTVAVPKSAPAPLRPVAARLAPVKVVSRPGVVATTPNPSPPSTSTSPTRGRVLTRTPARSGAGSSGPSLPVETKAPDIPTYDPGPSPQDMNLPTSEPHDETVFAPPVTASGRRGSMLPWILLFVGLAFAYTMTEERQ